MESLQAGQDSDGIDDLVYDDLSNVSVESPASPLYENLKEPIAKPRAPPLPRPRSMRISSADKMYLHATPLSPGPFQSPHSRIAPKTLDFPAQNSSRSSTLVNVRSAPSFTGATPPQPDPYASIRAMQQGATPPLPDPYASIKATQQGAAPLQPDPHASYKPMQQGAAPPQPDPSASYQVMQQGATPPQPDPYASYQAMQQDAAVVSSVSAQTPQLKFKCSRRAVQSFCVVPDGSVIMVSKKLKALLGAGPNKLATFDQSGRKQFEFVMTPLYITVAWFGNQEIVMANMENSTVYRNRLQSSDLSDIPYLSLKQPVLSKPVPGHTVYVIGCNEAGQQEVKPIKDRNTIPLLLIKDTKHVDAFDVSVNGDYFAVATRQVTLTVDVYQRMPGGGRKVGGFEGQGADGDLCFFNSPTYRREVLALADRTGGCITLLDHSQGCRTLGTVPLPNIVRLAKDGQGRLWAACEGIKEAEFFFFA